MGGAPTGLEPVTLSLQGWFGHPSRCSLEVAGERKSLVPRGGSPGSPIRSLKFSPDRRGFPGRLARDEQRCTGSGSLVGGVRSGRHEATILRLWLRGLALPEELAVPRMIPYLPGRRVDAEHAHLAATLHHIEVEACTGRLLSVGRLLRGRPRNPHALPPTSTFSATVTTLCAGRLPSRTTRHGVHARRGDGLRMRAFCRGHPRSPQRRRRSERASGMTTEIVSISAAAVPARRRSQKVLRRRNRMRPTLAGSPQTKE